MMWGNVYEVEFEQPITMPGMVQTAPMAYPVKVAAMNISEAIQKAVAQSTMPIASAKLLMSGVQW
jgi:hypothetical protein